MPLLGRAAMLLSFDVDSDAIAEHDDWHTHEHLPERLSIPGFLRGSRWVTQQGHPRYFVLYEVDQVSTLTSVAYLQRLNSPSPWTTKMMAHYRGMTRGLCSVTASFGLGFGGSCLLLRAKPAENEAGSLRKWLLEEALSGLHLKPGLGSVHLLEGAAAAPMTNEQRIRGTDATVDLAVVVTAYSRESLLQLLRTELLEQRLTENGAAQVASATYQLDYSLAATEIDA